MNPPVIVHVLPQKGDRRLSAVLFDKGHVQIVHEVDEAPGMRRAVRFTAPLYNAYIRGTSGRGKKVEKLSSRVSIEHRIVITLSTSGMYVMYLGY